MHQVDFVAKSYKPEEFLADINASAKENPALKPALDFIKYYTDSQPEYFKRGGNVKEANKALASETFAEVGSQVGPAILKDPRLAKYYKGIFQETPENYSGWVGATPVPGEKPMPPRIPTMPTPPAVGMGGSGLAKQAPKLSKIIIRRLKK